jgi:hypothetical protein
LSKIVKKIGFSQIKNKKRKVIMNYSNNYLVPSCEILVNGQKRKLYGKNRNKVYLNDGDEFQIKVYNPLSERVGFQLKMNGQDNDNSTLVVNPGQSAIIERFIGTNRKLKFSTYVVDKNNPQTQQAIKGNGKLEIVFYNELKIINTGTVTIQNPIYIPTNPWIIQPSIPYNQPTWPMYYCDTNIGSTSSGMGITGGMGTKTTTDLNFTTSNSVGNCTLTSSSINSDSCNTMDFSRGVTPKLAETGRIEQGKKSNQHFSQTNFICGSIIQTYSFKLLPFSEKPKEVVTQPQYQNNPYIIQNPIQTTSYVKSEGRDYCPNKRCNYRIRKAQYGWCPMCGTKID